MARSLLNLILAVVAIVLFLGGAVLLLAALLNRNDPAFAQMVNFIQLRGGSPWVMGAGVSCILLGVVVHFLSSLSPSEHFHFNTDLGGVGISLVALEQFIARQARALPMVESVRPKVTTSADGKRLRLSLETNVIATGSIKNVTEAVQEAVVNAIRDGLGLTDIETVDVDVRKIASPKGGLTPPPSPPPSSALPAPGAAAEPVLLGRPEPERAKPVTADAASAGNDDADEAHHSLP